MRKREIYDDLYRCGYSLREIADAYGVTKTAIIVALKDMKTPMRPRGLPSYIHSCSVCQKKLTSGRAIPSSDGEIFCIGCWDKYKTLNQPED